MLHLDELTTCSTAHYSSKQFSISHTEDSHILVPLFKTCFEFTHPRISTGFFNFQPPRWLDEYNRLILPKVFRCRWLLTIEWFISVGLSVMGVSRPFSLVIKKPGQKEKDNNCCVLFDVTIRKSWHFILPLISNLYALVGCRNEILGQLMIR